MSELDNEIIALCHRPDFQSRATNQLDERLTKKLKLIYQQGLSGHALETLLSKMLEQKFGRVRMVSVFTALIPRENIPSNCINLIARYIRVNGETTMSAILLEWLVNIYDYFESDAPFQKQYSVFFSCLFKDSMSVQACLLLYRCTRASNVTVCRIHMLIDLHRKYLANDHLLALLQYFQTFMPTVQFKSARKPAATKVNLAAHPNRSFLNRVQYLVHGKDKMKTNVISVAKHAKFHDSFRPSPRMFPQMSSFATFGEFVTSRRPALERIDSIEEFVEVVDQIVFPKRSAAILGAGRLGSGPLLVYLSSKSPAMEKIDSYLLVRLGNSRKLRLRSEMLEALHSCVRQLKTLGTGALTLLNSLITYAAFPTDEKLPEILDILECLPLPTTLEESDAFFRLVADPLILYYANFDSPPSMRSLHIALHILACFRRILKNWSLLLLTHINRAPAHVMAKFFPRFISLILQIILFVARFCGPPRIILRHSSVRNKLGSNMDNCLIANETLCTFETLFKCSQRLPWIAETIYIPHAIWMQMLCSYDVNILGRMWNLIKEYRLVASNETQSKASSSTLMVSEHANTLFKDTKSFLDPYWHDDSTFCLNLPFADWHMFWEELVMFHNHPAVALIGRLAYIELEEEQLQRNEPRVQMKSLIIPQTLPHFQSFMNLIRKQLKLMGYDTLDRIEVR